MVGGERDVVETVEFDYEDNNNEENIQPSTMYHSHSDIQEVKKNWVASRLNIVKIKECPLHEKWDTKRSMRNVLQEKKFERKYNFSEKIYEIEENKIITTGTQIVHNQQDHDEIKTSIIVEDVFKEPHIPLKTIEENSFVEEDEEDILMVNDEFWTNEICLHEERKDVNQGIFVFHLNILQEKCVFFYVCFKP